MSATVEIGFLILPRVSFCFSFLFFSCLFASGIVLHRVSIVRLASLSCLVRWNPHGKDMVDTRDIVGIRLFDTLLEL